MLMRDLFAVPNLLVNVIILVKYTYIYETGKTRVALVVTCISAE